MNMINDLTFNQKSLMFATFAEAAYLDNCSNIFASHSLYNYQHITDDDANGHIAFNATDLVISLRGTNPTHLNDWVEDINVWPEPYDPGKVHMGFKNEIDKLMPQILAIINTAPKRNVWICGHSLGGAMANLAATELTKYNICTPIAFTFGEPRSFNNIFLKIVKFEHHRFVNCNDIVPTMPPMLFGYRHHGIIHYITYAGNISLSTIMQRLQDKWLGHKRAWEKGDIFDDIYDHSMALYVQKIKQYGLNHA